MARFFGKSNHCDVAIDVTVKADTDKRDRLYTHNIAICRRCGLSEDGSDKLLLDADSLKKHLYEDHRLDKIPDLDVKFAEIEKLLKANPVYV